MQPIEFEIERIKSSDSEDEPSSSFEVDSRTVSVDSVRFLETLMKEIGVRSQKTWRNNNSTQKQRAYVVDLTDLTDSPARIIFELFRHNKKGEWRPLVTVPVAGWTVEPSTGCLSCLPCFSGRARRQRLDEEVLERACEYTETQ